MRKFSLLAACWLLFGVVGVGQETEPATPADPDVAAIEKAVSSYQVAFNDGDAKKLAEHFTADGEMTTASGDTVKGREALAGDFAAYFKDTQGAKLRLIDVSVNVIAPSVAIESGTAIQSIGRISIAPKSGIDRSSATRLELVTRFPTRTFATNSRWAQH